VKLKSIVSSHFAHYQEGKLAVLCLSPEAGQGVTDPEKRARIGEDRITLFQRHARGEL
jgi:hypothetical protein